jgi:hypothetical protein
MRPALTHLALIQIRGHLGARDSCWSEPGKTTIIVGLPNMKFQLLMAKSRPSQAVD